MMNPRRSGSKLLISLLAAWPVAASAQAPTPVTTFNPVVSGTVVQAAPAAASATMPGAPIGGHQIDRFEAIRQLQDDVKSDPNNIINWTILGELAHEVALDIPQGQDDAYYTLSRAAYERASQLDPNNAGLRSAVAFAREQETNAAAFDARRRQGVSTYLEARRREMAATGVNPTLLVYETYPTTIVPPPNSPTATGNQPYASGYPTPTYRPYYNTQSQQPYGYNQYSTGYVPPTTNTNQAVAPTTLRQLGQQLPGAIFNQGARTIGRPAIIPR